METRTGEIIWRGQTLTCRTCGGGSAWTLTSADSRAWVVCAQGHRLDHPLIYPAVVSRVVDWQGSQLDLVRSLTRDRWWYPHTATPTGAVRWGEDDPGWGEWPELVAGRALVQAVARWAAEHDCDTTGAWMMRWGTTEPDRTTITLASHAG